MKIRRSLLSIVGLSALFAAAALAAPPPNTRGDAPAKAKVGEKAPEFSLKDATGKEHKLSDYKGKIVVLEWINPKCPVCVGVMKNGVVKTMREDLKKLDKDFVHLMINSSSTVALGGGAEGTATYLKEHKMEVPGLIDMDGTVGHLYGARTTPHMYVIDTEGILRYDGAIDDNAKGDRGDDATNYVVNAVRQIKAGETVTPDKTRSYGCSVKYKK